MDTLMLKGFLSSSGVHEEVLFLMEMLEKRGYSGRSTAISFHLLPK
jgi:hypothetical protein